MSAWFCSGPFLGVNTSLGLEIQHLLRVSYPIWRVFLVTTIPSGKDIRSSLLTLLYTYTGLGWMYSEKWGNAGLPYLR